MSDFQITFINGSEKQRTKVTAKSKEEAEYLLRGKCPKAVIIETKEARQQDILEGNEFVKNFFNGVFK